MHDTPERIRVRLDYPAERVDEPVLYRLVRDFDLVPNILSANVNPNTGSYIFLELAGNREGIEKGIRFLQECGIGVSAIGLDGVTEWGI